MQVSTKIVLLGYASIALSVVWGLPGLACAVYGLRLARSVRLSSATPRKVARDVRGGKVLAWIGMAMSVTVIAVVAWSLVSTQLWMP